jgi:hypothetical protein
MNSSSFDRLPSAKSGSAGHCSNKAEEFRMKAKDSRGSWPVAPTIYENESTHFQLKIVKLYAVLSF